MRFEGMVAIVTGAGSGIGRATARCLSDERAVVVLVDCDEEAGVQAEGEILVAGGVGRFQRVDVTDCEGAAAAVASVVREFGRIDILVNNAGIFRAAELHEVGPELWNQVMRTNLESAFHWSQLAFAHMASRGWGRIVNVASVHGLMAGKKSIPYDVSKAGVIQLTRSLAIELAPHGVLVNAVAPGFVKTRMAIVDGVDLTETDSFKEQYLLTRRIPLGRVAGPEDVARTILFLASDDCRYMTGQTLVVDGGLSIAL